MKKILYITTQSPFETYSGGHQRSRLIFKALCEIGKVDLVSFTNDILRKEDKDSDKYSIRFFGPINTEVNQKSLRFRNIFSLLSTDCIEPENNFCSEIVAKIIEENEYDYIVIRYIQNALKCGITKGHKIIIDVDDLPEQLFFSVTNFKGYSFSRKIYYYLKSKVSRKYTNNILKNIHHSFLPNKEQIKFKNSSYLPNIPYPFKQNLKDDLVNITEDNSLLFVGLMSWHPNYNGVEYFLKKIFPFLLKSNPLITFNIVGKNLPGDKIKLWSKIKGVNIKGFVENINFEYNKSSVVIVPIFEGAGSNIKVLEAMKNGKTTVLSSHATRGFEDYLVDGKNVFIANNDQEFIDKTLLALSDKDLNKQIAQEAKKTISEEFSFEVFKNYINKIVN